MIGAPPDLQFCTACGAPKSTPYCTVCGVDQNGVPGTLESLTCRPNWGAFLLPGLWTFWHGRPLTGVVWWLLLVAAAVSPAFGADPATGLIIAFAVALYLLMRGNQIALSRRRFRDVDEYVLVERRWARWGIGAFAAVLFVIVALVADWFLGSVEMLP